MNINSEWTYLKSNTESLPTNEQVWRSLDLPHSWNALDATDNEPGYRRGAGWYKKELKIDLNNNSHYSLYFEGASITTKVYVNKQLAGTHVGGFVGFEIVITDYLLNGVNEILIRVDNDQDREIIPSSKADFFIFGGITRDVWLKEYSKEAHIQKIEITTPQVSQKSGETFIKFQLSGSSISDHYLKFLILDNAQKVVYTNKVKISNEQASFSFTIKQPKLWNTETPYLYTVQAQVLKGNNIIDELSETYGYRWFEFKEHGAFYLNGEKLKLRGTHRHEEHAGYGAAVPNEIHRRDIEMIKEMGANMIRLAHYPQDPEVYKACNELGIIVWDELPWCRGGLGNDVWKANTKRLLKEMIEQNYNHPSIVFWSLGNEVYWLPDFENGDNRDAINVFLTELNELAHKLDPNRLTSIRKYYEGSHIPDVFSSSIWSGWYSGKYTDYQASIDAAIKKYDHFLHAEYGGSSHIGRHSESIKSLDDNIESTLGNEAIIQVNQINYAQDGDWSENYIVDLFDWHLKVSENTTEFSGNIQWAFKDFGTPLRPENDIPYINQKGLVDREGNPKDAYYVFKSYWSTEPFTYIESSTWTERYGGKDEIKKISVYSNCTKVVLHLNGKSLGEKVKDKDIFPASGLEWEVSFREGENELVSVGFSGVNKVYDTLTVNYHLSPPNPPTELKLSYQYQSDGSILITARAIDMDGRLSTEYQKKVYFQSLSGGTLKKHHGTPTGSNVIAMANGKASVIFYPDPKSKVSMVMVLNQDFKGTHLAIPSK